MATPYANRFTDHRDLVLPDGRPAERLRLASLRSEMNTLGVIVPADAGKTAILNEYQRLVDVEIERILQGRGPRRTPPTGELMLLAAKAVDASARKHANAA